MGQGATTIVIEPRSLMRQAFVELMARHSYQVLGGLASTADVDSSLQAAVAPELVILGSLPADEAAFAADDIRKRWPDTKIILLFDRASSADCQRLLGSQFDGCIPLLASPETLVRTLQQIIAGDLRILVLETGTPSVACPTGGHEKADMPASAPCNPALGDDGQNGSIDRTNSFRIVHGLSKREEQILKSVVRGHSNKIIARTCGVTDATIKVHMKSILRKIRVENRTQAAIWALERGYGAESSNRAPVPRVEEGLAAA
jgi:two-component system nitrate/nitrite response regulator NarL